MSGIIRSEWVKLRRPAYLIVPILLAIAFSALITVVGLLNAEVAPKPGADGPRHRLLSEFTAAHGSVVGARAASNLISIVVLVIFAAAVATEFQTGTIRNLLIREPRRIRLMFGRWLGLALFALLIATVTIAAGIISGLMAASSRGVSTSEWFTSAGITHIGSTWIYMSLGYLLFGTFGFLLALLFRSAVASIGASLAYLLIAESILVGLEPGTAAWVPGGIIGAVMDGGNDTLNFWPGLGLAGAYFALAGFIVLAWFRRADITN
jgi:hypothetical protein